MVRRIALILIVMTIAASAYGYPTSLNIIPTADVLSKWSAFVYVDKTGSFREPFCEAGDDTCFQIGLGHGVEIGYDTCSDDSRLWNAKMSLLQRDNAPNLAVGVLSIGNGSKPQPYGVATTPLGKGRLHLGLTQIEGAVCPMLGYDIALSDRLTFQADFTAGDDNASSVGFWFDLGTGFGVNAAYTHANSGDERDGFALLMGWSFHG